VSENVAERFKSGKAVKSQKYTHGEVKNGLQWENINSRLIPPRRPFLFKIVNIETYKITMFPTDEAYNLVS
jgi:hypothetical protein